MTNWKTTIGGLLAALGAVVLTLSFPWAHTAGSILAALGSAILGLTAQDAKPSTRLPGKNGG